MRVLTYNIWDGGINDVGGNRQAKILEIIRESGADLVAIQEARGFVGTEFDTLTHWTRALGMQGAIAIAPTGYHVALLVRPPLKILSSDPLHPKVFYNACLNAYVETPLGVVRVLATHLNPFDPSLRLSEARHLARESSEDQPVLLLGDFNGFSPRDVIDRAVLRLPGRLLARHLDDPNDLDVDTRAIRMLEFAGFVDLYRNLHPGESEGHTIPTRVGHVLPELHLRLDYIFATAALAPRARSCSVLVTETTGLASDHYPVMAEFE